MMAIKNRDGTTFELRKPNPAMSEQSLWDPSEVVLHNFRWKTFVVPSGHDTTPLTKPTREPTIADELFEPEPEPQPPVEEPVEIPAEIPVEEPIELPSEPEVVLPPPRPKTTAGKLQVHCLPASIADYSDDLYGQKYKTIQYNEKFVTDAGVVSQGDLEATFWSSDPRITVGSILYPISMEKRWWKVVEVEERPLGGYFIRCQISDSQPRFA